MPTVRNVLGTAVAALFGAAVLAGCAPQVPVKPVDLTTSTTLAPTTTTDTTTTTTVTTPPVITTTTTPPPPPPPPVVTTQAPAPRATTAAPMPQAACGPDTYRNVDGNCIPRPKAAPGPPAGATAHCKDGTYSFSAHRSGTCSGHGGVAEWL